MLDLIEKMLTIVPKELEGFFFWNGGSDAVEGLEFQIVVKQKRIDWICVCFLKFD